MSQRPKVSVLCLTFNQKKYIEQALEGFLDQVTNFKFEVLINDDHSTDGTLEVLKRYQKKYPETIKLVLQKENLYSKGLRNFFLRFLIPKSRGQYLALCEGDDYWTDPHKLQKQVDFLEKHSDYALCFHPVRVIYEDASKVSEIFPVRQTDFTLKELLEANFIQTNSVMYRKQNYKNTRTDVMPADWYLHLYNAQFGKIGFINNVMSVYRKHPGGIWWESHGNVDKIWEKHGVSHLNLYLELLSLFGSSKEYRRVINTHISTLLRNFIRIDEAQNTKLLDQVISNSSSQRAALLISQNEALLNAEISKDETIIELRQAIQRRDQIVTELKQEISEMRTTLTWKLSLTTRRTIYAVKHPIRSVKKIIKRTWG